LIRWSGSRKTFLTRTTFSTVLLAGGASKRMGRDKALLPVGNVGQVLWQRQWDLLEELTPEEMLWSGPPRADMPERARIIADAAVNAGPLGGIAACLKALRSDVLVVLAVDLPQMRASFLRGLLARCTETRGAVAQYGEFFEPLAAIYPKHLHSLAAEHLAQGRYAMQDFIREAINLAALEVVPVACADSTLFKNFNAPSDL
jgi:molybdopterin-guanine dinucleotide biosynthesis protein A